jgi:hypothetical protein
MRNKVRIQRLTLAPVVRQEDRRCSSDDAEVQWILNKKISRMVEMVPLSSSSTTSHHMHGVEDWIELRFWQK